MNNIQKKLSEWAEKAYSFYYPKAKKLNLDFYTQSDLTLLSDDKPVELMVIGINPGFGGKFQPNRFACSKDLLHGNVVNGKHVEIQEMRILKTLRTILEYSGNGNLVDNEGAFVFTNATFFSTPNESGLNGIANTAQLDSIVYTKKLIEIIQPKHIICLGGKNCTDLIVDNTQPLLSNIVKLEYGVIGNIPVYGINHTSSYWSIEEMELVSKALDTAFSIDSAPIEPISWEKFMMPHISTFCQKRNDREEVKLETHFRWQYVYTSLCNYAKYTLHLEVKEKNINWTRFVFKDSDGKDWLIIALINQVGDKSIGVRYLEQPAPRGENFECIMSRLQTVDCRFKAQINSTDKVVWLGKLDLTAKSNDTDKCIREAKELLDKLKSELCPYE